MRRTDLSHASLRCLADGWADDRDDCGGRSKPASCSEDTIKVSVVRHGNPRLDGY
jgi:hypothetical protein